MRTHSIHPIARLAVSLTGRAAGPCVVTLVVAWLCSGIPQVGLAADPKALPNILFIQTDDQAAWALGASGDMNAQTPHLDRLFQLGAYFINSFVTTPVCSPSRAGLVCSRYGSEVGITDWINPANEPELGLDPATLVWPKLLADGGYQNALIGKWHLGTQDRYHPNRFGYSTFTGFRGGGSTPQDPVLEMEGVEKRFQGCLADILTDQAIAFVEEQAHQPFALSLHFREPHAPWLPTPMEDWKPFAQLQPVLPNPDFPLLDKPKAEKSMREYLSSVASVDRNVGRLLQALDRLQLSDRTIVIFTSDHGYNMGHHGIWHKGNGHWLLTTPPESANPNVPKGQRPNLWDTSIRVPTVIFWPGITHAGQRIERTITQLDWMPTLLEIAGITVPEGALMRGRSLVPLLKEQPVTWDDDLFVQYSTHHQSKTHMRAYRTREWKLILDLLNTQRHELYDLRADPAEMQNLFLNTDASVLEAKRALLGKLRERMEQIQDPVLDRLPTEL